MPQHTQDEREKKRELQNQLLLDILPEAFRADIEARQEQIRDLASLQTANANEIERLSLGLNVDPTEIVDEQLAGMGPGKMLLKNFMLGMEQSGSGQRVQTIRKKLFEREVQRQEFVRERVAQLEHSRLSIEQQQTTMANTGVTQANQFAQFQAGAAGREQALEASRISTEVSKDREARALAEFNYKKSQEASSKALRDSAFGELNALALFDPNVDTETQNTLLGVMATGQFPGGKPEDQKFAIDYLASRQRLLEGNEKRKRLGQAPAQGKIERFQIGDSIAFVTFNPDGTTRVVKADTKLPSKERQAFVNEILPFVGETVDLARTMVDLTGLEEFSAGSAIFSADSGFANFFRTASTLITEGNGSGLKALEISPDTLSNITPLEQNFITSYKNLGLSIVRRISGAQVTDQERDFIFSSLPNPLVGQSGFQGAIKAFLVKQEFDRFALNSFEIQADSELRSMLYNAASQVMVGHTGELTRDSTIEPLTVNEILQGIFVIDPSLRGRF